MLHALQIANQNRQIEAEIRNMGKRSAGIERERRERGKNRFGEVTIGKLGLRRVELRIIQDVDALFLQARQQL